MDLSDKKVDEVYNKASADETKLLFSEFAFFMRKEEMGI